MALEQEITLTKSIHHIVFKWRDLQELAPNIFINAPRVGKLKKSKPCVESGKLIFGEKGRIRIKALGSTQCWDKSFYKLKIM